MAVRAMLTCFHSGVRRRKRRHSQGALAGTPHRGSPHGVVGNLAGLKACGRRVLAYTHGKRSERFNSTSGANKGRPAASYRGDHLIRCPVDRNRLEVPARCGCLPSSRGSSYCLLSVSDPAQTDSRALGKIDSGSLRGPTNADRVVRSPCGALYRIASHSAFSLRHRLDSRRLVCIRCCGRISRGVFAAEFYA